MKCENTQITYELLKLIQPLLKIRAEQLNINYLKLRLANVPEFSKLINKYDDKQLTQVLNTIKNKYLASEIDKKTSNDITYYYTLTLDGQNLIKSLSEK